jgi:hypothetical protein
MTLTRAQIEDLVVRIQADFLNVPGLRLSLGQATVRFGITSRVCEAVLQALVEARVLTRSTAGGYERFLPLAHGRGVRFEAA